MSTNHSLSPLESTAKRQRQDAFLEAFSRCGTVYKAAQSIGITRQCVEHWRRTDAEFQERMATAHATFGDYLQDLALQKVERLESKDNLLHLAMLNAHVPELYKPERSQTTNNVSITKVTYVVNESASRDPLPATDAEYWELPQDTESGHPGITDSVTETDAE